MTTTIIITLCTLLLIAYIFDITSSKTKVPSVVFLLLLGWLVQQASVLFKIRIPDLTPLLPVLGTIGLILIVLEGSLELELKKSKIPLIKKSFFVALVPLFALAFLLAFLFHYFSGASFKDCMTNAIPLCVISSAIAIPSVKGLARPDREFVIYESSFSDILGVLAFNFVALNSTIGAETVGIFLLQLLIIAVISFVATLGLSFLLSKIDHHIKFAPIILLIILIYAVSKVYHLPGLIFILFFGLFLGNLDEMKNVSFINKLQPVALDREVKKFKEITIEATFIIRALFFLLFGYLIKTEEILNTQTLGWAAGTVTAIFVIRALILKLLKFSLNPLFFIAPRGLITILLFFSIDPGNYLSFVNKSLIIQVILFTAAVMMIGMIMKRKNAGAE
jgi:Kef-type K+ transport system membrane component KefB